MPIDSKVYLTTPSETSTEQVGVEGEVREFLHPTLGFQLYRMVKATTLIPANLLVAYDAGSSVNAATSTATSPAAVTIAGIAQNAIPAASYGWVCCGGSCTGIADAAVAQNAPVVGSATDGQLDDPAGAAADIIGVSITDGAGFTGGEALVVRLQGLT